MSPHTLLKIGVIICLFGCLYRIFGWVTHSIEPEHQQSKTSRRSLGALGELVSTVFSKKILPLIYSFFTDILFQQKLFVNSLYRWLGHAFILSGFVGLLIIHGLGANVSGWFFSDFEPSLSPYLFLHNLFGLFVLLGIAMSVVIRIGLKKKRIQNNSGDWLALTLIGLIIVSGFLLEGVKISSYSVYSEMVVDYGPGEDEMEDKALEAYWVAENGLFSPRQSELNDPALIAEGKELNEFSCAMCHDSNQLAFVSINIAGIFGNAVAGHNDKTVITFLTIFHLGSIAVFLIWLPFGKMFHVFAAPVSLLQSRVRPQVDNFVGHIGETAAMIGLSSCTHCSACTIECSSAMYALSCENELIFPSEKVWLLQKVARGGKLNEAEQKKLQHGLYICTSCDRCTRICPSGINLKELFLSARYYLLEKGVPEVHLRSHFSFPLIFARAFEGDHLKALKKVEELFSATFIRLNDVVSPLLLNKNRDSVNRSYQSCYACQRCTNICPVVRGYENPAEKLGLLPHQIIFSLGSGNIEFATGTQMIWSCSSCYLCQEHCPNGVELTDIFYELKNRAMAQLETGGNR